MAIAAPSKFDEPTRQPGDFRRNHQGAPWVRSLSSTRKRKGVKADLLAVAEREGIEVPAKVTVAQLHELLGPEPADDLYGRPSGLGKQIENQTALQKWSERAVALGIIKGALMMTESVERIVELTDLGDDKLTLDDPDARELLDKIAVWAKAEAQAGIAAERGTHTHALTEDFDNEADWIERARSGEDLGIPQPAQQALVAAWEAMLDAEGIEILAVETAVVDDEWRQAGTLDRIARLTRDRTFTRPGGELVTLPAGWVGVLDVKTGRLRAGHDGHPDYWHGYAVQIASYAQAVPYDPDTDTRSEWEWPIDQEWGIIAHLDVQSALDGEARCRLVLVDLEAGREAGAHCVWGRSWEKRRDVFSLVVDDGVTVPVEQITATSSQGDVEQPAAGAASPAANIAEGEAVRPPAAASSSVLDGVICARGRCDACGRTVNLMNHLCEQSLTQARDEIAAPEVGLVDEEARREALRHRKVRMHANARDTGWAAQFEAQWASFGITPESTNDEIQAALDHIEPPFDVVSEPAQRKPTTPDAEPTQPPDNGGPLDQASLVTLLATIKASPARAVVNGWLKQSADAGESWSPRIHATVRHFEISRAAFATAIATDGDDDYARLILAHVVPGAEQPVFPVGVVLGTLSIDDARRVTAIAEAFGNRLTLLFHDDGSPRLVGDVAAVLAAA